MAFRAIRRRNRALMAIGAALLIAVVIMSVGCGNYNTSATDVVRALSHPGENPRVYRIITLSRLPRLIASLAVGVALAVSGFAYQEILSNRMASPDTLGVSAGAACGASAAILLGWELAAVGIMAFAGGMIAVTLTTIVARLFSGGDKSVSLILSGIIIGGLLSSLLGFLKYASNDQQLASITFWLLGSFYSVTYTQLAFAVPFIVAGVVILYAMRWQIIMLKNGDEDAMSHGINARVVRTVAIITATTITSLAICISGTVGWIGLAIPNLARMMTRYQSGQIVPLTVLYGMTFTAFCDFVSRTLTDSEIPVGVITGVAGALIFIVVLISQRLQMVRKGV